MTDENQVDAGAASGSAPSQAQFGVQRIYVKDMSFETPMAINARSQAKPAVSQDLHTKVDKIAENQFEVVLNLTVTVKQEDKVAFLCEVHQAGLFHLAGLDDANTQHTLSSTCPSILFPYAREAIDNMASRGGFPPLMLPPINFDAVYAQAMSEAKARAESQAAGSSTASDVH